MIAIGTHNTVFICIHKFMKKYYDKIMVELIWKNICVIGIDSGQVSL